MKNIFEYLPFCFVEDISIQLLLTLVYLQHMLKSFDYFRKLQTDQ
jgi:hypothetical protein